MTEAYRNLLDGNARFGTSPEDICRSVLHCEPDEVLDTVILAPVWRPETFSGVTAREMFQDQLFCSWQVELDGKAATYIIPGIGAPQCMDIVLALGTTRCKRIIFVGSAGALDERMEVGDVVLPSCSVCGDGASRYLGGNMSEDCFGQLAYPSTGLLRAAEMSCRKHCAGWDTTPHIAKNFSIDTITAQFAHIDEILALGCGTIEMETAACFKAAEICGIEICAVFSISDSTIRKKSLYSGRTPEDQRRRREIRREVFPKVLGDLII